MIENLLINSTLQAIEALYNAKIDASAVQVQNTRKEFGGDFTIVTFPFVKISKKSPDATAKEIGDYLKENIAEVKDYNVIKGFLNICLKPTFWLGFLKNNYKNENYGFITPNSDEKPVVIEFSSPNTNKPLHLGHIRNNLLGQSLSNLLKAAGKNIIKVNLVNDRGIHICKSMLAWQKWGNGETPITSGIKGDHLVGKYYVVFDKAYKEEIKTLIEKGLSEEDAKKQAPLIKEAQDMLLRWEQGDEKVRDMWKMMNGWVYEGFDQTYKQLGIDFNKTYYESQTYLLGKRIVDKGLNENVFQKRSDGSVWIDLTEKGLDEKLLLRSDGTSVYITQDLGTAQQRYEEYNPSKLIYVVGNEQEYHFQVLKMVLKQLGYHWADDIFHLSYGMVELPHGKMKSREGTVVDADDLMQEMFTTSEQMARELGKLDAFDDDEAKKLYQTIGLGALKYFILKVDPKKNMMFNPQESIDFNGNTGPFIQYTYARIKSIFRKAQETGIEWNMMDEIKNLNFEIVEMEVLKKLYDFSGVVNQAATQYSPAIIANYAFDLASLYNRFYHDVPILKETDEEKRSVRLSISLLTAQTLNNALNVLGIDVPERM